MQKPLDKEVYGDVSDQSLIDRILAGSRDALEALIARYQGWIYNVALRMTLDHRDAEDVSQEILIKLITKLSTYEMEKASFRTWLHRIVANHVLTMKKKKYEQLFSSIDLCENAAEQIPDEGIDASPDALLWVEELKIKCMTGLLLCLDRRQRFAFIMSEIFDVSIAEGSAMMQLTEVNFRQVLSRARKKIYNFTNRNCGLISPDNPCHCHKKLKGFIRHGFIDPNNLLFYKDRVQTIEDVLNSNKQALERICYTEIARRLFKSHPFYDAPEFDRHIGKYFDADLIGLLNG